MTLATYDQRRLRVLQVAYACEPYYGSEQAVGWNWANEIGKTCDVWVICCEDDCRPVIEQYCRENGEIPHVNFVFLAQTATQRAIHRFARLLPFVSYLALRLWHYNAYKLAKQYHSEIGFDIVHHVNFIGYREPGYLWKLNVPFVWGPIGGTQNCPLRFSLSWRYSFIKETLRTFFNSIQLRASLRVRRAASRAAAILAANSTAKRDIERILGRSAILLNENGIKQVDEQISKQCSPDRPLRMLWVGACQFRKSLNLLLLALSKLSKDLPYELRIVGDGEERPLWQEQARRLGVSENIEWLGRLPHDEALEQYHWSDVFVFTSLRDTTGTVVLEALANGVPVICLDHQGAHDVVSEQCGIKIPVTTRSDVVQSLSQAIVDCVRNRDKVCQMGESARERARTYLWRRQGERMAEVYRSVLPNQVRTSTPIDVDSWYAVPDESVEKTMEVMR